MPDLVWDDVAEWCDPVRNGVLPDAYGPGTTVTFYDIDTDRVGIWRS